MSHSDSSSWSIVLHRSRYLVTFYTDDGVLPRALLFEQYPTTTYSIHALSGPPPDAAETLPDFRWRKYLNSLSDSDERADRFAARMCETASAQTDKPVQRVTVTDTTQPIGLEDEREAPTTETVVERSCSSDATSDRNPELRVAPTRGNR